MVIGKAVFIGKQDIAISILNSRTFANHEIQNNWLMGFRMDFNYEIKIINKKHPKHKQILKLINISVEHGIKQRADDMHGYGVVMLFYVFEKLSNSKVFDQIKYEIDKRRDQVTFGELSNVFAMLLAAFPFLFVVFIIECIYYKFHRKLSWF